jgi:hypothetical protein
MTYQISPGEAREIHSGESESIILTGTGKIIAFPGEELVFREVTITPDTAISAEGLTVISRLTVLGKGSLSATAGTRIELPNRTVVIEMYAQGKDCPRLNLGDIGSDYSIVPKEFKIGLPAELTPEELRTFSHPLVVGSTLSNCGEWNKRLKLTSSSFRSECVSGTGARLLSEAKSLVIKGISATSTHQELTSTDGLSGGAIAGIAVGSVAGAGSIGAAAFVLIRRRKKKVSGASP